MDLEGDLLLHLQTVTGQSQSLLGKILEETRAWYAKDLATWIRDRHRELQRQGLRNREIYPRLQKEARQILVRPAPLSERQVRRMIYG
jgi:hypothetical protein